MAMVPPPNLCSIWAAWSRGPWGDCHNSFQNECDDGFCHTGCTCCWCAATMPVVSQQPMLLAGPCATTTTSTVVTAFPLRALSYDAGESMDPEDMFLECGEVGNTPRCYTARQTSVLGQLQLPVSHGCPSPADCSSDEEEQERRNKLLETYQNFAMDLHNGMDLMQLSRTRVRCHLLEDLATLTMDRGNGDIIEFPLANVTRVRRLVKFGGTWHLVDEAFSALPGLEQQAVLIFQKRRLAFVFEDKNACDQFMLCMGLLIARAREHQDAIFCWANPTHDEEAAGLELAAWLRRMCCVDETDCLHCSPSCSLLAADEHIGNLFACMGPPPDVLCKPRARSEDARASQRRPRRRQPRPQSTARSRQCDVNSPLSPSSTVVSSSASDTTSGCNVSSG